MEHPPADARKISVGAARLGRWLDTFGQRHGPTIWSLAGSVVHGAAPDGSRVWITVPFPPLTPAAPSAAPSAASSGDQSGDPSVDLVAGLVADLVAHALRPRRIGVLLVRRGGHAAGVFDGLTLLDSKVGSSYVQGTTKAGGWSQQRFARRRDNQARAAFDAAADTAARVLLPPARTLDAVICGGDRAAVDAVLADPRLKPLVPLVSPPWLAVPDPRLRVLKETPALFTEVGIVISP